MVLVGCQDEEVVIVCQVGCYVYVVGFGFVGCGYVVEMLGMVVVFVGLCNDVVFLFIVGWLVEDNGDKCVVGEIVWLGRDLHQAYERLETLYESAQVVGFMFEFQEVLDWLIQSIVEVMGVKGCTICLVHEMGTELCLVSIYGLSDVYLQKGCILVDQNLLVCQVLGGEVVVVADITVDDWLQYLVEVVVEGIWVMFSVLLLGKACLLGILRVYCDCFGCFSEEDAHFLVIVAWYGSIAIENAMVYEVVQNLEEVKCKFVLMVTYEL